MQTTILDTAAGPHIRFTAFVMDDEGGIAEIPMEVPAEYQVCDACRGSGASSAYLGVVDMCDDPDWLEDYMAGLFDRPCPECQGRRVVAVPLPADRLTDPADLLALHEYSRALDEHARLRAAERSELIACYGPEYAW